MQKKNYSQLKETVLLEYTNVDAGKESDNFNPTVVDEFLGCDVVLDGDQTVDDVNNGDDLETFYNVDNIFPTNVVVDVQNVVETLVDQEVPSNAVDGFEAVAVVASPLVVTSPEPVVPPFGSFIDEVSIPAPVENLPAKSPGNQKRRRGRSQDVALAPVHPVAPTAPLAPATNHTPTRPVVIALSASAPAQIAPHKPNAILDEDDFRKSPSRQSLKPARPALFKRLR